MRPITFARRAVIPYSASEIAAAIADPSLWSQFKGYGPLPGIESAVYEKRTDDMAGSIIRVRNTDGSAHVEEILVWEPERQVVMKLHEFTPPLARLADRFIEEWTFEPDGRATHVTRRLELYPTGAAARPVLWLISLLFRRAVAHHLEQMAAA